METINKKLQPLSLLIAEDDESTLKWLVRVLSIYFKDVRGANDAMEALVLFKEKPADIVLSDIQMPGVDGLHLLQKIATISPDTLRVVMTAFNSPEYLNRSVEAEVNFYLKKPIDIDELLVAIAANIPSTTDENIESIGNNYFYDNKKKMVLKDDELIKLTKKEILLLELLLQNKQSIVSTVQIENYVWEEPVTVDAIRMVLRGLRKKLYPEVIENIKGVGYRINL